MEVAHPQKGSSSTWFPVELEFGNVGFWGEGKTEVPGENLSANGREPLTNSTNIWRRRLDSNPGHIGGKRALSPLRHPCFPKYSNWERHYLNITLIFDCQCNKTIIKKMLSDMSSHYICTFTCPSVLGVAIVTDCTNLTTMPWKSTQQKRELEIK